MKFWDKISRWFNEAAQYHADRKTYRMHMEKLTECVEKDNAKLLKQGLQLLAPLSYSNRGEFDMLIHKAIEMDHEDSFSVLYEYIDNPDYTLSSMLDLGPGVGFEVDSKSLLYKAIDVNSPKIALILAKDPQVDITKSGRHQTSFYNIYGSVQNIEIYNTPLKKAEGKPEFKEVEKVLTQRTADIMIQRSNELKAQVLKRKP